MSRTFRRKNFESEKYNSWTRQSNKIAGYYTVRESWLNPIYRKPTESEFFQAYWENHGESKSSSARSPNHWWKNFDQRKERRFNERELFRWAFKEDYEPMFKNRDSDDFWWYWD